MKFKLMLSHEGPILKYNSPNVELDSVKIWNSNFISSSSKKNVM